MQDKQDWLVIANGESLPNDILLTLAKNKSIMVLDGACTTTLLEKVQPQIVLGDFDSISASMYQTLQQNKSVRCIHDPDQNTTDLEKGLQYLEPFHPNSVSIVNATGWRLDHTLYNMRLLKRFHNHFKSLVMFSAREKIVYIQDQVVMLTANSKEPLALLAFPEATVSSWGLEYNMQHLKLQLGYQESLSNALVDVEGWVSIVGGALLLASHCTQVELQNANRG